MANKIITAIFVLVILGICYSDELMNIQGKKFAVELYKGKSEIQFYKNKTYEFTYDTDAMSFLNSGKYSITNSAILLEPDTCQDVRARSTMPCGESLGRAECRFAVDNTSLYYSKYLQCTSREKNNQKFIESLLLENENALGMKISRMVFPVEENKVKPGTEVVYNGIPVIVLPGSGITTTLVKIREKPSTSSKALTYCATVAYDPSAKEYDAVPKNTMVRIIARTRDKYTVGKWNNYWYCISVGMNDRVWMFGEFIKLK